MSSRIRLFNDASMEIASAKDLALLLPSNHELL